MSDQEGSVNVARFKAQISRYLKAVKRGEEVTITDRNLPVARVVPIRQAMRVEVIAATQPWQTLEQLGIKKPRRLLPDPVRALMEERRKHP